MHANLLTANVGNARNLQLIDAHMQLKVFHGMLDTPIPVHKSKHTVDHHSYSTHNTTAGCDLITSIFLLKFKHEYSDFTVTQA